MYTFEYDPHKSRINTKKHGISFGEAQRLWYDNSRLTVPAKSSDEPRYAVIARYAGKYWTAFCTDRADKIRIISVRRARKEEQTLYES